LPFAAVLLARSLARSSPRSALVIGQRAPLTLLLVVAAAATILIGQWPLVSGVRLAVSLLLLFASLSSRESETQ
jgi:hypothetical protein